MADLLTHVLHWLVRCTLIKTVADDILQIRRRTLQKLAFQDSLVSLSCSQDKTSLEFTVSEVTMERFLPPGESLQRRPVDYQESGSV